MEFQLEHGSAELHGIRGKPTFHDIIGKIFHFLGTKFPFLDRGISILQAQKFQSLSAEV